ncbi:MAG: hypothetical protein JSS82_15210 [Bacteroidetes bacterium]|nr:hypothetical protein [Bacteroidota bacterium]
MLNILMISDNARHAEADIQMLKDRGMHVYTCLDYGIAAEVVNEVRPDVIFINPEQPGKEATELYHTLLDNVTFATIPVVYVLVEDDVYLVDRKRTASRERRNLIADNAVDAIRLSLSNPTTKVRPVYIHNYHKVQQLGGNNFAARA